MKTEVKKIDGTKTELFVEVSGDVVKNKFREVFEKIGKEVKVPGFRPGHIPADILEKNFFPQAREIVLKELIPDVYNQAVDKEALDAVDLPDISEVKIDRANLSFKATVEVSPRIELKKYKGILINYKKIEVIPDDVKRNIDALKEARKVDVVDDSFARSLGYPDIQELEAAVQRQIFIQKDNQQRQKIESDIIETLTGGLDFKLPESLVARQLQDLIRQAKVDLALKGMPREKIDEQEKTISEQLRPEAQRQIRIYLVLAEIAKKENIPLDQHMSHKVMEFLLKEAQWKESI
ncbi:MAG: trigger factor [Deltaproteobacteria bacterium]